MDLTVFFFVSYQLFAVSEYFDEKLEKKKGCDSFGGIGVNNK